MEYNNVMATSRPIKTRIQTLKREYDTVSQGKESLLSMIDEVEIAESVYNSNAIENSTLTLGETERILLEQVLSRNVSMREVFEAKSLARVTEYKRMRAQDSELNQDLLLLLHQMLLGGIDDAIAGRFPPLRFGISKELYFSVSGNLYSRYETVFGCTPRIGATSFNVRAARNFSKSAIG